VERKALFILLNLCITSPEIKAVTFDIGGTLIEPWPSVGHIYAEVAARHGHSGVSPEALNRSFADAWSRRQNFNHARSEWAALVDETFLGVSGAPAGLACFDELFERFAQPGTWRIFPDVLPALEVLASRDLKLGVISNWDERLRPLLGGLKLHDYFQVIVISCEVGFSKPSPVLFEHTARQLGLPLRSILHIGDSPEHDFAGARGAGGQALLLNRSSEISGANQIRSLAEL
jgi:putative hydrolase of the HAD superfamily